MKIKMKSSNPKDSKMYRILWFTILIYMISLNPILIEGSPILKEFKPEMKFKPLELELPNLEKIIIKECQKSPEKVLRTLINSVRGIHQFISSVSLKEIDKLR